MKSMTYAEAVSKGILDGPDSEESQAYAWELKSGALRRFTSAELMRELEERSVREVIRIEIIQ